MVDDLISKGLDSLGAFRIACRVTKAMPDNPMLVSDILIEHTANKAALAALRRHTSGKLRPANNMHSLADQYRKSDQWPTHWLQTQWLTGMVLPRRAEACLKGFAYRFSGAIEATMFHNIFQRIVQKHDILRNTVRLIQKCGTLQSHLIPVTEALVVAEIDRRDQDLSPEDIQKHVASAMRRVNISEGPIIAVSLVRERGGVLMLIGVHHATFDGQSEAILKKEIDAGLLNQSLPSALQYRDTLDPIPGDAPPDAWSKRLGIIPAIQWPETSPKPTETYGYIPIQLEFNQIESIGASRKSTETDFLFALKCFGLALQKLLGCSNFRLGYTDNGRYDGDLASTLGNYVRLPLLPMDDDVFQDIDNELPRTWASAFENREVPILSQTAQCAFEPGFQGPLLQALVVWQNVELPVWTSPGVEVNDTSGTFGTYV